MDVVFEAKAALDRAFGPGNRRSSSLTRLMLRLDQSADRRRRVDTVYRVAELLAASSNDLRRHQGKTVSTRGVEFFDSLPQPERLDLQDAPDTTA